MSTIAPTQPATMPGPSASAPSVLRIPPGHRDVFRGVGRDVDESLSETIREGEHVRLAYDGKDLEIVVTSNLHENWKELLGKIVKAVTTWASIACVSRGEATWTTPDRGLQADLSYSFDPEKIQTARDALARESMGPANYPNPDLAIEIDMSGPKIDRPAIYADLGVVNEWAMGLGRQP